MRHKALFLSGFLMGLAPSLAAASPDPEALDQPRFHALLALGAHYHFGGRSPETGFDCSGLVAHAYERAWGLPLPHSAREQAKIGKPIKKLQELEPGDLVFYNTRNSPYSHVGIYLGDGRFIHAPRTGARVRVESVHSSYWKPRFNGARRLARNSGAMDPSAYSFRAAEMKGVVGGQVGKPPA
jgi:cell wall-associated NlpC family hydrolase